jgi:AcrR family transcriptional regulator
MQRSASHATTASSVRSRTGTQSRGEDTRRRLVDAAIDAFGTFGYEGTSTRLLAERAGTTLPAIPYYFGSKEGLFRATIEHIAQRMGERMAPIGAQAAATLARKNASRKDLLETLGQILDAFVALMLGGENPERRRRFIARVEIERGAALEPLHESIQRWIVAPSTALVGRLLNQSPKNQATLLRTLAILGQVSVFCHLGARRVLGWEEMSENRMSAVQTLVRQNADAILRTAKGNL